MPRPAVVWRPNFQHLVQSIRTRTAGTHSSHVPMVLVRDVVLFTVALRTAGRGGDWRCTVLKLPRYHGLVFSFQFTKMLRSGAIHSILVEPALDMPDTCAIAAMDWYAQASESCS